MLKNGVQNGSSVSINGLADNNNGLPAFTSTDRGGLPSITFANIAPGVGYRGKVQIGEVLVYDTALSDATCRNVEARLRNKWLGASKAPVPVINTVPTALTPDNLASLKLRLDASDSSSLFTNATGVGAVTTSGQPVGYWGDLSGNDKPATQGTAGRRPIYTSNQPDFNGRAVLQFDGVDDDITT